MDSSLYAEIVGQVQLGPVYHCWVCGEPVGRLVSFHEWVPAPTMLDAWADHLAYLELPSACQEHHHPARVVVVGPAITPVDWPERAPVNARIGAIQQALTRLAELAQRKADGDGSFDRALALALRLHARVVSPAQGAQEIRVLGA